MNGRLIAGVVGPLFILLFVYQYAAFVECIRPEPIDVTEEKAAGAYSLRVVTTFDCQGNDFGVDALSVVFRDQVLLKESGPISSGLVNVVHDVAGVKVGANEFFVQFCPVESGWSTEADPFGLDALSPTDRKLDDGEASLSTAKSLVAPVVSRAARFEILKNEVVVGSYLLWSDRRGPFSELLRITVSE